jgi:putative drug exporter of the RND superfamily
MLTLFGRAVWWLPGWLARLLPRVDIEGESEPPPPPQEPSVRAGQVAGQQAMLTREATPDPPP